MGLMIIEPYVVAYEHSVSTVTERRDYSPSASKAAADVARKKATNNAGPSRTAPHRTAPRSAEDHELGICLSPKRADPTPAPTPAADPAPAPTGGVGSRPSRPGVWATR